MALQNCPLCRQLTPGPKFCTHCGGSLNASPPSSSAAVQPMAAELARCISDHELQGMLDQQLVIPAGYNGLLFEDGALKRTLNAGRHTIQSLWEWLSELAQPRERVVLQVDPRPVVLPVSVSGMLSQNAKRFSTQLQVVVEADDAGRLLQYVKRKGTLTAQIVASQIAEGVSGAVRRIALQCTSAELVELHPELKSWIQLEVAANLEPVLLGMGLKLLRIDHITLSNVSLDSLFAEAERLQGQLSADQLQGQYQRKRKESEAAWKRFEGELGREDLRLRLEKSQSQRDFDAAIRQLETEAKIDEFLRQQDLDRAWNEYQLNKAGFDHALATLRQFHEADLARKDFEFRLERLVFEGKLSEAKLEQELQVEQLRFAANLQREQIQHDQQVKQRSVEREQERLDHEQDMWELDSLLNLRERKKQFDHQLQESAVQSAHEREQAALDAAAQRELARLQALGQLSPEALISASPEAQAKVLAELKKLESMKGMSSDQILALAASNSPELAKALADKSLFERLLSQKDETLAHIQAAHRESMAAIERVATTAMMVQRDTTVAAVTSTVPEAEPVMPPQHVPCPQCSNPCFYRTEYCSHCGAAIHKPKFGFGS